MSHRNKGKMPGKHANPRTWRRWRIRNQEEIEGEPINVMGISPPHIDPNVDPSTGGGGGNSHQHFNSLGGKSVG